MRPQLHIRLADDVFQLSARQLTVGSVAILQSVKGTGKTSNSVSLSLDSYILSMASQAIVYVSETWQAVEEMCECIPSVLSGGGASDVGSQGVYSSLVSILGFGQEIVDFGVLLGRPRPQAKSLWFVNILQRALVTDSSSRLSR